MKIDIDDIGEEGLTLQQDLETATVAELLGDLRPFEAAGAGRLRLQIIRSDSTFVLRGRFKAPLSASCGRCLGLAVYDQTTPIEITLVPVQEMTEAAEDGELTDQQVSLGTYEGHLIDVGAVIHDEVVLALPMQPLCREACLGLCNRCGNNLNDQACACGDAAPAGPLGALGQFVLPQRTTKKGR